MSFIANVDFVGVEIVFRKNSNNSITIIYVTMYTPVTTLHSYMHYLDLDYYLYIRI